MKEAGKQILMALPPALKPPLRALHDNHIEIDSGTPVFAGICMWACSRIFSNFSAAAASLLFLPGPCLAFSS